MSELGQYLKTKREEQGITIENLQEMTKIQKRYLTAIEEGRYDSLPGSFYTRAFVKSYAEALRLNPEDVFETYGNELPQPKQQTTDLPSRAEKVNSKAGKTGRRKSPVLPALLGVLFLLVVAAAVYLVVQGTDQGSSEGSSPDGEPSIEMDSNETGEQQPDNQDNQQEEGAASSDSDSSKNNEDGGSGNSGGSDNEDTDPSSGEESDTGDSGETNETVTPELVETVEGNRSIFDVSGAEEMVIELSLSGNSWLGVEDENGNSLEDVSALQPGDSIEMDLSDEDYIKLIIGSAPNATVQFNGEKVEYPIDPNEKVLQHLIFEKQPE
ncbi:helix-turn-helix domain-containing protein [Salibacterium lacus]|uniref:Helix-turn-helix domain-containing protein n=1 Tax=Salibacterium lacus TaxID=1898109 RepID=A0ABW5SYC4_9BACI